tara:strand:+ start:470 stop:790 length:321 start_codon:yes stop_codon:yes gene_type:complete
MARRGRRGSLSPKTFFPATGDQLEDPEDGIVWVCGKSNNLQDEHTGEKVRYALLIGRSSGFDESLFLPICDQDKSWMEGIVVIRRKNGSGFKTYSLSESRGTWLEG